MKKNKVLRLLSTNPNKVAEFKKMLEPVGYNVIGYDQKIHEIQSADSRMLIRDKLLKAFSQILKPVIVEHTALQIAKVNGLPGGLTSVFWDALKADGFCDNFRGSKTVAITTIGYCDGKQVMFFEGKIEGQISDAPRGSLEFQWDPVFIPDGYDKTFAELGDKKNTISMRKKAIDVFLEFLKGKE